MYSTCYYHQVLMTTLTTDRQTSMPPVGFEPTISAGEQPQTYALDRVATGTGRWLFIHHQVQFDCLIKWKIFLPRIEVMWCNRWHKIQARTVL